MAIELKTRSELDPKFQWKLTDIFESDEKWEQELTELSALVKELAAMSGTLGESAESLAAALKKYYGIAERVELAFVYAHLYMDCDNGNTRAQAMKDRGMRLYVEFSTNTSFLIPEVLSIPEDTLKAYMEVPELQTYRHILEDISRGRAHTLDKDQERMLAMLSDAAQGPDNCFTMLESVDMKFPCIMDEKGNEVELTHGNFSVFRESADRRVRREAFEKYFGEFNRYINTLTAMYASSVKFDQFFADARKHPSAAEAALFENNVPMSVYHSLISAVHDSLPAMQEYLEMRRKAIGVEELHLYDLYCPMIADVDFHVTYEEAKELVKEALKSLGEEYAKYLDTAYANNWIDVYENKGKTTGAFSCGVHGVHPYVLLNFQGKLDDAFTLAHELGHAMHSYRSSAAQAYHNHDYRILVAEVASTVNEVLLLKYLLAKETDEKRRAYLLNHFLEGFRTTLFRQTLFAEFELKAHEMVQHGEPLTAESLNSVYRGLNELYYNGATVDELDAIEWARIPHFYNAFYVYQYATGYSSAVAIANHILTTGDASDYLRFLSTGGSDYPLEELKIAGVDLTSPEPVKNALKVFADTVKELHDLLEVK